MKIDIIYPALPPQMDGIGHYTASIAEELARHAQVRILVERGRDQDPISGVAIIPAFSVADTASVRGIVDIVAADPPDWVVLQYNPFSYGKWGLNLHLPGIIPAIRRRCPNTRVAVMAHETYVYVENLKFAVMTTWQRYQFFQIGRAADILFLSTEPWLPRFCRWFPGKPVQHLPIGSSIPRVAIDREEARRRLGIGPEAFVVGLFGTSHYSRMFNWVGDAVRMLRERAKGRDVHLLYIGPHAKEVREATGVELFSTDGALPPEEVSQRFAAMDLYLSPYLDGAATRRTGFITGLQHGVATVATRGIHTDAALREQDGKAFFLPPASRQSEFNNAVLCLFEDPRLRTDMGAAAVRFHDEYFAWERISKRMLAALAEAGKTGK